MTTSTSEKRTTFEDIILAVQRLIPLEHQMEMLDVISAYGRCEREWTLKMAEGHYKKALGIPG